LCHGLEVYIWKRIRYLGKNKVVRGIDRNFPQMACRGLNCAPRPSPCICCEAQDTKAWRGGPAVFPTSKRVRVSSSDTIGGNTASNFVPELSRMDSGREFLTVKRLITLRSGLPGVLFNPSPKLHFCPAFVKCGRPLQTRIAEKSPSRNEL
jgi:hypothetical protein